MNLTVNGKVIMSFPSVSGLGMPDTLKCFPEQTDGLVLGSVRSSFKITSLALLPLKGSGRVLKPGP